MKYILCDEISPSCMLGNFSSLLVIYPSYVQILPSPPWATSHVRWLKVLRTILKGIEVLQNPEDENEEGE